jgi:outer membrane protein assembly factor BamB
LAGTLDGHAAEHAIEYSNAGNAAMNGACNFSVGIWVRGMAKQIGTMAFAFALLGGLAPAATRLVPQDELKRVGLTRAWFGQVQMDRSRHRLDRAMLQGNRLTALTSAGVVEDFDALTGASYWVAPIGNDTYPSLGPACSDKYVAVMNGSTLYVLDRTDGRPVNIRRTGGAPGAGPALSQKYVFVPLVNGRMEGYSITDDKKLTPWYYQSSGRTMVTPLATPESIVWTTETGNLYVGNSEEPEMRFRLETKSEILAPPSYRKPLVFVASASGEVFAMDEMTGKRQWKYATGFPVTRSVAAVGDRAFVTSEEPALHCIDIKTGSAVWQAPHMLQFSAASKTRVYGVDDLGGLVVLDAEKGSVVGRIAMDNPIRSLVNDQTDRLYLVSSNGTIECLRETDAKEPLYHNPKEPEAEKKTDTATAQSPKTTPPAETESPAASKPEKGAAEKKDESEPAKKPEQPAGNFGVKDSDNPFGN